MPFSWCPVKKFSRRSFHYLCMGHLERDWPRWLFHYLCMGHLERDWPRWFYAVARRIGCSSRLLEKDFQSVLGRTVVAEIGRVRMATAQDMIKHTQKSEESIALACGYGSVGTLRNTFHAKYGMSIRKWRSHLSS